MASLGHAEYDRVASSCAMVKAPFWRMVSMPCAPSLPMPVRITPTIGPAFSAAGLEQHVDRRPLQIHPGASCVSFTP